VRRLIQELRRLGSTPNGPPTRFLPAQLSERHLYETESNLMITERAFLGVHMLCQLAQAAFLAFSKTARH
jgi:hypothetical protein